MCAWRRCPNTRLAEISLFLNGRDLPSRTALRALADYAGIELNTLLDINLAERSELIKRPVPPPDRKRSLLASDGSSITP